MIAKVLSVLLVSLIILLQYRVWYSESGRQKTDQLQKEITQQKDQNILLKEQNKKLKKEIYWLRNHPEALEEKAREELGMIKKGEIFYRVIPAQPLNAVNHSPAEENQ